MAAKLVAEEGTLKGLVLSLEDSDQWVIGRDPDACQLLIEDPSASRKHLICRTTPKGILLENLSTTNPVQVNDVEVKDPLLLKNGDTVKIGSGIFRFYAESAAQLYEGTATKDQEKVPDGTEKEESKEPEAESPQVRVEVKAEEAHNDLHKEEKPAEKAMVTPEEEHMPEEEKAPAAVSTEQPHAPSPPAAEEKHDTIYDEEPAEKPAIAEINFGLLETGRWLLKVIGGPNNGAEFPMQTGSSYIIGTDPYACDVVFHDTSVSRQHARITVGADDKLNIEDLKSRNKTLVDNVPLQGKVPLNPNSIVSMGTTAFVVFDREGEMQTIVAPLMPSIVNALKTDSKEEQKKTEEQVKLDQQRAALEHQKSLEAEAASKLKAAAEHHTTLGAFLLIAILTGILVLVGIGTATLFKSEPIAKAEAIDYNAVLNKALASVPSVHQYFNKNTGQLQLIGHVLTTQDRNQLLYSIQGLNFIKTIDDSGLIIDEGVYRETNQLLEKNPDTKGITIISASPGHFVLTGYMRTRAQADKLIDYLSNNFPYPDLLENRIIVEEDIINAANQILRSHGLREVTPRLENGELSLSGSLPQGSGEAMALSLKEIQNIRGIRTVYNEAVEMAPEENVVNISDKYQVSGTSSQGNHVSVVINGRILTLGDLLDGMTVKTINPAYILLDKDNVKYRIDVKR